ncbi:MAG: hypothetical protein U0T73_06535 [Chitinophagales bacterium]
MCSAVDALFAGSFKEKMERYRKQTLIVILESPRRDIPKKWTAATQEAYLKSIDNYNRSIRQVVDSFWVFNQKVEYKTWAEVEPLIRNHSEDYLLLYSGNFPNNQAYFEKMERKGLNFFPDLYKINEKRDYFEYFTGFCLDRCSKFGSSEHLAQRTIANLWPLKEDIAFAVQFMQLSLMQSLEHGYELSTLDLAKFSKGSLFHSVLMIKSDLLYQSGLQPEDVKSFYADSFEVVSYNTLVNSIFSKSNICYIEITPAIVSTGEAYRLTYEHFVMNAATGELVAYVPANRGILHATQGIGNYHKFLSAGIFADYVGVSGRAVVPIKE